MIPIIGPILAALTPFTLMMVFVALAFGIGLGLFLTAYLVPNARVMYCRERDKRGLELNITNEDHLSVETRSKPPLRFWKVFGSYEFPARFGKKISTFFGKEGTAYSWVLQGFHTFLERIEHITKNQDGTETTFYEEVETLKEVNLEFETLEEVVESVWGPKFYATVPDEKKELLQNDKLLVTVGLEPGLTPEGFTPVTETDINRKGDQEMANIFAKAATGANKGVTWGHIAFIGTGVGIGIIASILMGWIVVGG